MTSKRDIHRGHGPSEAAATMGDDLGGDMEAASDKKGGSSRRDGDLMDYLYDNLLSEQEQAPPAPAAATEHQAPPPAAAAKHQDQLVAIAALEKEKSLLQARLSRAKAGFDSLLKTAREEIARKDDRIAELKRQVDDLAFRRALKLGTEEEFRCGFFLFRSFIHSFPTKQFTSGGITGTPPKSNRTLAL